MDAIHLSAARQESQRRENNAERKALPSFLVVQEQLPPLGALKVMKGLCKIFI